MDRTSLDSSMIAEVAYNEATQTLEVLFQPKTKKDGTVVPSALWQYANVPKEVYEAFIRAESPGRFFGMSIKGAYEAKKVEEVSDEEETKEA